MPCYHYFYFLVTKKSCTSNLVVFWKMWYLCPTSHFAGRLVMEICASSNWIQRPLSVFYCSFFCCQCHCSISGSLWTDNCMVVEMLAMLLYHIHKILPWFWSPFFFKWHFPHYNLCLYVALLAYMISCIIFLNRTLFCHTLDFSSSTTLTGSVPCWLSLSVRYCQSVGGKQEVFCIRMFMPW